MVGLLTGNRIRDWRISRGMRQTELAHEAGISPSYLNLIEHNRRKIGGRVLNRIARALDLDPSHLADGGEATLLGKLAEIAQSHDLDTLDAGRTEAFASQFPGWAQMVLSLQAAIESLEGRVKLLGDRLSHDPKLAEALHEVITAVTSIRSTASILVEGGELDREWTERFHKNVYQDSLRLAEQSRALVSFLEKQGDDPDVLLSPVEEAERALSLALDTVGVQSLSCEERAAEEDDGVTFAVGEAARFRLERMIEGLRNDERLWPYQEVQSSAVEEGGDLHELIARSGRSIPLVLRRYALWKRIEKDAASDYSYFEFDSAGQIARADDSLGLGLTAAAELCPKWPVFAAQAQPGVLLRQIICFVGREKILYEATGGVFVDAATQALRGYLVVLPTDAPEGAVETEVGPGCRFCVLQGCLMRREPSLLVTTAARVTSTSL